MLSLHLGCHVRLSTAFPQYSLLDVLIGVLDTNVDLFNLAHQLHNSLVLLFQFLNDLQVLTFLLVVLTFRHLNEGNHLLLRVNLSFDLTCVDHVEEGSLNSLLVLQSLDVGFDLVEVQSQVGVVEFLDPSLFLLLLQLENETPILVSLELTLVLFHVS